jgi:hypothetical protein
LRPASSVLAVVVGAVRRVGPTVRTGWKLGSGTLPGARARHNILSDGNL